MWTQVSVPSIFDLLHFRGRRGGGHCLFLPELLFSLGNSSTFDGQLYRRQMVFNSVCLLSPGRKAGGKRVFHQSLSATVWTDRERETSREDLRYFFLC